MKTSTITAWSSSHTLVLASAAAGLLVVLAVAVTAVRAGKRRGATLADTITVLIALASTVYAGTGTMKYLRIAMDYSLDLRLVLVCVLEGAVIASGLRARKNIAELGRAGVDGAALWVLTALSGFLSASVASNVREAVGRVAIPAVGAWLWERLLAPQRRAHQSRRASSPVRWRITPERIFVFLRLADAVDTDVSTVEAGRRVSRYLRATDRAARSWRWPLSPAARADRARMRLTHHALMHGDPGSVHTRLSESAFAAALTRLGVSPEAGSADPATVSRDSPDGPPSALVSLPLRKIDLLGFAQDNANHPPASGAAARRPVVVSSAARRQASVTARIGAVSPDVARVFRESLAAGKPLSSRTLARRAGVSQSTAHRVITDVRAEGSTV